MEQTVVIKPKMNITPARVGKKYFVKTFGVLPKPAYKPWYKSKYKPELNIENIWHPYLVDKKVVKNTIAMKNNLLITGPNAAGKSTFIKSIIINILLSQTIGVNSCKMM